MADFSLFRTKKRAKSTMITPVSIALKKTHKALGPRNPLFDRWKFTVPSFLLSIMAGLNMREILPLPVADACGMVRQTQGREEEKGKVA
jgi:hypothetical protein